MRILQIYEMNPLESVGGIEVAILELSKQLVKLGHEVSILTGAGPRNGVVYQDGIEIINFDFLGAMKHTYSSGRLTFLRQLLFLSSVVAKGLILIMMFITVMYTLLGYWPTSCQGVTTGFL